MPHRKKPNQQRPSAFADRQVIAKAEGRFAKADKQRASITADPKEAVQSAKEHLRHVKKRPSKKIKRPRR
jgi:hypothetical protein